MDVGLTESDRARIRAYANKSRFDRRPDDLLPPEED